MTSYLKLKMRIWAFRILAYPSDFIRPYSQKRSLYVRPTPSLLKHRYLGCDPDENKPIQNKIMPLQVEDLPSLFCRSRYLYDWQDEQLGDRLDSKRRLIKRLQPLSYPQRSKLNQPNRYFRFYTSKFSSL